ncbi:MAG: FtsX-like permease family protein [Pseudomonadota bacterium]|nr:ABC transporter permease [Alphaproteobacteria bacterium]MED5422395.1 FtsX-like permease family protein [Pseudomonadota bacterium]
MNDFQLITSSLKNRWLNVFLSVLLTALGVTLVIIITQFGHHIHSRLTTDGKNIDIVIGAKGSPLQLVLSSIYHIDVPTGNIPFREAQKWMKHPHVKHAIPLALGDSWKGHRIVGTSHSYIQHYKAEIMAGRAWQDKYEVVVGAAVPLNVDNHFIGAHGLSGHNHQHDNHPYTVVGKLKPSGTVLDRLILTSVNSVLDVHGQDDIHLDHSSEGEHAAAHDHHGHHEHHNEHGHQDEHAEHNHNHTESTHSPSEITAILIKTKTPIANINLPRTINKNSALLAANPALETARLSAALGIGVESFTTLSFFVIVIAALSIFSGLAGSLENRSGDLAVLRAIGYTKTRIIKIILAEGAVITTAGLCLGVLAGIFGFNALCHAIAPLQASGAQFTMTYMTATFIVIIFIAGVMAALVPAIRAANIDIIKQLSTRP